MQNPLPNNKIPHSFQNIFLNQSKRPTGTNSRYKKQNESTDVRQDKRLLTKSTSALEQPASVKAGSVSQTFFDHNSPRTQNYTRGKKLIAATFRLKPLVYAELKRKAEQEGLSFSQVGSTACEEWVRYDLHRQHEGILIPALRQVMREELTAFGNRIVYFLLKIAFPIEQANILITNVLKWVCKLVGLDLKAYYQMVDDSSSLATKNILAKAPHIKDLMEKWQDISADDTKQGKEKKN